MEWLGLAPVAATRPLSPASAPGPVLPVIFKHSARSVTIMTTWTPGEVAKMFNVSVAGVRGRQGDDA